VKKITCNNAFYVKLGRNGVWETSSLESNIIRIGWAQQSLEDINGSNWKKIQRELEHEIADKGAATRDCRALRMLCESTSEDIWITFHGSHLWWAKVTADPAIYKDEISKYRKVEKWHCQDIAGESLLVTYIPGRISKVQGFRGTICKVKEDQELTRLINGEQSPEYIAISRSKNELCSCVEAALRRLHWKDFETLVDLVFRATGWRRVSVLGETMKFSDIELEDPINDELYQVQVKSAASFKDFQQYSQNFQTSKYRKLFFVVHTPDKKLSTTHPSIEDVVQLVLPKRLAEMVVDLGLINWLMNKVR